MNRMTARLFRSAAAGAVTASGIGLGAFNAWWVALIVGVPLVVAGVAILPRATRISELPRFRRGVTTGSVPIEITAMTRSTLAGGDDQPTLVTARVTPADDTEYEGRWISAMARGHFTSLTGDPQTTLPADRIPSRTACTPGFSSSPGRRAALYPLAMVVAGAVVLFGVPESVWNVDLSLSSTDTAVGAVSDVSTLDRRRDALLSAVQSTDTSARHNILSLTFADGGSDRAQVYDPATGEAVNLWISGGEVRQSRSSTNLRKPSTFDATEVASTDIATIVTEMGRRTSAFAGAVGFSDLTIARGAPGQPVLLSGTFENPDDITDDHIIEATPAGRVAEFFQPGDFTAAFATLGAALSDAGIPTTEPVLTRLEIRGLAGNTPIMFAGQIQNSGGALAAFSTGSTAGQVVVVPGRFPEVTSRPSRSRPAGFRFDDVGAATFDSVRRQAMQRGAVEVVDRNAIDIQATTDFQPAGTAVILVAIGDADNSEGTYTLGGQFLRAGYH